jgi:hypothetical protein
MMKRGRGELTAQGCSRKWVASAAALLIVAAQLLALAHSHNTPGSPRFEPQAQTVAADDICGLCLLVFHAPLSLASKPALDQPRVETVAAFSAETYTFASGSHSFFLTRAPPSLA